MSKEEINSNFQEEKSVISQEDFYQQYEILKPSYERLGINLQQALKGFLAEKSISYLDVLFRVKDAASAYEKIIRKNYGKPFDEIEDWCGLRIICYYPSDVDRICEILTQEFDIKTQEDTASRLAPHEFGYRSTHFILTVKESWMQPPNYRGLANLKTEVQVRTILMHAWAEIEHKLAYKSTEQVPDQFKRLLYRLSAKFEEADEQFETLRNGLNNYRQEIKVKTSEHSPFPTDEFNLDTFQAFLDAAFPDRAGSTRDTRDLFQEIIKVGLSSSEVYDAYAAGIAHLPEEEESWRKGRSSNSVQRYAQVGAMRTVLDIGSKKYAAFRKKARGL